MPLVLVELDSGTKRTDDQSYVLVDEGKHRREGIGIFRLECDTIIPVIGDLSANVPFQRWVRGNSFGAGRIKGPALTSIGHGNRELGDPDSGDWPEFWPVA
jgi:hypothetical protein